MESLKRLVREVHRRSLWQVLAIYLAASWAVLEAADVLIDRLALPSWIYGFAIILLLVGVPIVLATAFVQEGFAPGRTEAEKPSRMASEEAEAPSVAEGSTGLRRLFTWRNALLGGIAALALWGVIVTGWLLLEGRALEGGAAPVAGRASADDTPPAGDAEGTYQASVAVLPFENLGSPDDGYFSEGVTEEIISQLAGVQGLKVISRTSVLALQDDALTLPEIADTLGVRHVLEGSVRRWQDQVRITAQLIDAETDAHLWAESFTRELAHLFDLQDEIAGKVTRALVTTVEGLRPPGRRTRTEVMSAHDAYLAGQQWMRKRTPEGLKRALEAFEEAIALDSTYAPAYAGLARALTLRLHTYPALARALALADRAIELDPNLAEGYLARGHLMSATGAPKELVAPDFERALELQPNSADLRGWYAHFLTREGHFERALAEDRKAVELDPLAPGRRSGYAADALVARRYDIALREARRALALEPGLVFPRVFQALSLLLQGRAKECTALDLGPRAVIRAACLYSEGERSRASAIVDSVAAVVRAGNLSADPRVGDLALVKDLALYHAWVDDAERSLEWLERGYDLSPQMHTHPRLEIFDGIRDQPDLADRFERLQERAWDRLRRMHLEIDLP